MRLRCAERLTGGGGNQDRVCGALASKQDCDMSPGRGRRLSGAKFPVLIGRKAGSPSRRDHHQIVVLVANEVQMSEKATSVIEETVSSADIRRLCGDAPDWKIASIAALLPTQSDIEVAVAWADRDDEACGQRALEGKAAQVFDILTADEGIEEDR